MELESGLRRQLLADATVNGHVAGKVYKFRLEKAADDDKFALEGTGGVAIVVYGKDGWSIPDPVQTAENPIVHVDIWADPTRDAAGNIAELNAEDKIRAVAGAVDRVMHGARGVRWGTVGSTPGVMIVSCQRWQELVFDTKSGPGRTSPLGNDLSVMGDLAMARVRYAVQMVHEVPA